jgi:hypothetical protein
VFYFRMLEILLLVDKGLRVFDIDIFVNYNWVDTRWQQYSTHLHTNNTWNDTINNFHWKALWDSNPEWSN